MRLKNLFRKLVVDTRGTTVVELAIAIPIFLLLVFGAIDFARYFFHFTATEKALAIAVRTASVRPEVCPGLPDFNLRTAPGSILGSSCTAGGGTICQSVTRSCTLAETGGSTATADEIWNRLRAALPRNAQKNNIRITYTFDPHLNFLGGPYVPNVSMEIEDLEFTFVAPIASLATIASGGSASFDDTVPFPRLQAMAPGEDLAAGTDG